MEPRELIAALDRNVQSAIKGKPDVIKLALIGLIARGHILIEDVPGVGKTLLAMALAQSLGCTFKRVQFTSDLLPSDILGVTIYNQKRGEFEFRPGPIFTNILLADEINRTTPKTQSALLQAMNNAQVSVDQSLMDLPQPFLVFATQNPVEHQGTYPLPEAQKDRFMLRLRMGYPDRESERLILSNGCLAHLKSVPVVTTAEEILALQGQLGQVAVEKSVMDYILNLLAATRSHLEVKLGASTRAGLHLVAAARAHALVAGRGFVTPFDVKAVAIAVLSHRLILKRGLQEDAVMSGEGEGVIEEILQETPVPE